MNWKILYPFISYIVTALIVLPSAFAEDVQMVDVLVGDEIKAPQEPAPVTTPTSEPNNPPQGLWQADPLQMMAQMEAEMNAMDQKIDALFDRDSFGSGFGSFGQDYTYEEEEDSVVLYCQIPNVNEGSLDIKVQNNQVMVQGMSEGREERSESGMSFSSYSQSSFFKQFPLHEAANPNQYEVNVEKDTVVLTFKKR